MNKFNNELDWDKWHKHYGQCEVISFGAAGITFNNSDGVSRISIIEHMDNHEVVSLKKEANNVYDKNAIAIHTAHGVIGYVPKDMTDKVAPHIDNKKNIFRASKKVHEESGNYGVIVHIMIIENESENTHCLDNNIKFIAKVCGIDNKENILSLYIDDDSFFDAEVNSDNDTLELFYDDEYFGYIPQKTCKKLLQEFHSIGKYNAKLSRNDMKVMAVTVDFNEIKVNDNGNEELYVSVLAKILTMDEAIKLRASELGIDPRDVEL